MCDKQTYDKYTYDTHTHTHISYLYVMFIVSFFFESQLENYSVSGFNCLSNAIFVLGFLRFSIGNLHLNRIKRKSCAQRVVAVARCVAVLAACCNWLAGFQKTRPSAGGVGAPTQCGSCTVACAHYCNSRRCCCCCCCLARCVSSCNSCCRCCCRFDHVALINKLQARKQLFPLSFSPSLPLSPSFSMAKKMG